MRSLGWFSCGAVTLALVLIVGLIVFVRTKANGFSTRTQPSSIEGWSAHHIRSLALPESVKQFRNPEPDSVEVLAEARAHWADHCANCHANNGSGDVEMGKRLYPPAPDMRQSATQNLTDGELFYVIKNGIRFTGMPAWGNGANHDDQDSWKLVRFIRHLPSLSASEEQEMEEMNPKSPDELKEEQQEKEFLNGGDIHEQHQEHHH
jgi:mono/diheme cytochrome c family protein